MLAVQNAAPADRGEEIFASGKLLRWARRRRHFLFAALAALYLFGFNGQWQIEPDSALYLSLARNVARGEGYTYLGVPHHLVYPGVPYALAALFRLFPGREIAACDALVLLCGLAALALTYRLFRLACDQPTAVVVTLLTGLAHEYFRYCFEIMIEMPFLLGVMALLAGHEALFSGRHRPRWWDWAIFLLGALIAIVSKPMMLALLLACIAAMPWLRGKSAAGEPPGARPPLARLAGATAILLAMLALFFIFDPRHVLAASSGDSYEHLAVREAIKFPDRWRMVLQQNLGDLFGKSAARVIIGIPLGFEALGAVFGAIVLAAGIALWRIRKLWGIWVAAVTIKLVFFYSHDRYLIPILPLLMFGWWRIIRNFPLKLPPRWREPAFFILLCGTIAPNFGADVLADFQQHQRPFLAHYRDGRALPLAKMANEIAARTGADDTILSIPRTSRILSYLSGRRVIEPRSTEGYPASSPPAYVVIDTSKDDPGFDKWISKLHLVCEAQPLVRIEYPSQKGRALLLLGMNKK